MDKSEIFIKKIQEALEELFKEGVTKVNIIEIMSHCIGIVAALLVGMPESLDNKMAFAEACAHSLKSSLNKLPKEQPSNDI